LTSTQNADPSVVLVHGAYADGSSWSEVMHATTTEIDSGHLSLITHPEEVTQLIVNAVQAVKHSHLTDPADPRGAS